MWIYDLWKNWRNTGRSRFMAGRHSRKWRSNRKQYSHLKQCISCGLGDGKKVTLSRYRPGVAQRVDRGIALLFHDRGTRRGEWSATRPGRTLPPVKTRHPFYKKLRGPQGRSERAENLVPTGIRSRIVQPVVSRYTDWATIIKEYPTNLGDEQPHSIQSMIIKLVYIRTCTVYIVYTVYIHFCTLYLFVSNAIKM